MKAIVTGAASGIGRATAHRLARNPGAKLVLADRDGPGLDTLAAELQALGAEPVPVVADLADPAAPRAIVEAAAPWGALDALVSNAGTFPPGTALLDMTLEQYDRMFAVNTRATWLLAVHSRPLLARACGAIVATASISAQEPTPMIGNYSATKSALVMLIRQLALELGPEGIRCNSVSPGTTRTAINTHVLDNRTIREARSAMLPLRRIGTPGDVANAILFLLSPEAAYITGTDLLVDGGLNATLMQSLASAR